MEHTLIVAGIGPGDPDYILPKAQKAIEGAHYLVGGRRALSDYAKPSQETYPVTGKLSLLASWLEEALKKDDVVVMVSGIRAITVCFRGSRSGFRSIRSKSSRGFLLCRPASLLLKNHGRGRCGCLSMAVCRKRRIRLICPDESWPF